MLDGFLLGLTVAVVVALLVLAMRRERELAQKQEQPRRRRVRVTICADDRDITESPAVDGVLVVPPTWNPQDYRH